MSMSEGLDKAIKLALAEGDTERLAMLNGFKNNMVVAAASPIPGLDVNKYVEDLIKNDARTSIEPEDVGTMNWDSGYIAPDGKFYGCPDIQHREFSKDLAEKFGLLPKKSWLKAKRGERLSEPPDCEIIMDKAGWVRVSVRRFFWDREFCKITQGQFVAIKDFMNAKQMDKAVFNDPTKLVSFEEGIKGE